MPEQVVGTVVGVTNPREFYFAVAPGAVQVQDLVCVDMRLDKPEGEEAPASGHDDGTARVWAKVADIERINPLFPEEAAQELSTQRLSAFDTVISLSREMITAKCTILGKEEQRGENVELSPLTYPLQPASSVYLGDPKTVEKLLIGNVPEYRRLKIGHLRGRPEFPAYLDGHAIVARHLAVMAATGAGKTVTVRRILEELVLKTHYPVLIFDPHSDYIGLGELPELKDRVTIYFPALHLAEEEVDNVISLVRDLSGEDMTGPQESLLKELVELVQENWSVTNGHYWDEKNQQWNQNQGRSGWKEGFIYEKICPKAPRKYCLNFVSHHFYCLQEVLDALKKLYDTKNADTQRALENAGYEGVLGNLTSSYIPVRRQLGKAASAYRRIRSMNQTRLRGLGQTNALPKPSEMDRVIQKGKVSIVSLEGYSAHATAIVANLMRQLFELRLEEKNGRERIPKFLTVVEEAHNFVPSFTENLVPSLEILRQIATEGRKYGMGLILISQRPSRVDATVLSQCNSFVILKIINPADQKYVREVVETLGEDDAKLLPDLATGETLITGECVRFPILAKVEMPRSRGRHEEEDFIKDFVDAQVADARTSTSQAQISPKT